MTAILRALAFWLVTLLPMAAHAEVLRIGVQEAGTVQWEIATIQRLGLDTAQGVTLEIRPLADSRAGQIALQAGEVDVILSDFVWVSIQRHSGNLVAMVPHSLAIGGLMVPAGSPITGVGDLEGKTIAVAGGPADKSWVTLQAYYNQQTGRTLVDDVDARFGAPPLVNELLTAGRANAGLNFWQWNARAKVAGLVEVLSVKQMLADLGVAEQPPLLGWTFTETTATNKHDALVAFLDASFAAKAVLVTDDSEWVALRDLMGAGDDDQLFAQLRDDYRAGIVTGYDPNAVEAATQTYALLARYGGSDLVRDTETLAAGTFWQGYSK